MRRILLAPLLLLVLAPAAGTATQPAGTIVFAADRAPQLNAEIYRVDPNGARIDLSRSGALDLFPSVSPDGKQVAFLSTRGGHVAVDVVGTDGHGLRRLSPLLFAASPHDGLAAQLAWAPSGRRLAIAISGSNAGEAGLYLGDLRGGWRTVVHGGVHAPTPEAPMWSADGRLLSYTTGADATLHVVDASGRKQWTQLAEHAWGWSRGDRIAVSANSSTVHVYDARGRTLARYPGASFGWSPNGVGAAMVGRRLQLRRGGVGKPYLDVRLAQATPGCYAPTWVGSNRLLVCGGNGWIGYDVAHRRPWPLPVLVDQASAFAPDGTAAVPNATTAVRGTNALELVLPGAAAPRVLATAGWCGDELPFASLQFVPGTRSLVYQSACAQPSADLYAIQPGGTGLRRLTSTPTDETEPSLSPDGTTVAFEQQDVAERCQGCPQTIWRMPLAGGAPQQLTTHTEQDAAPFDTDPSWSPDGRQIAFLRAGFDVGPTIVTMPATGGAVHGLGVRGLAPAWGRNGIAYVLDVSRPALGTIAPATGARSTLATLAAGHSVSAPAWSPDGRLAYVDADPGGATSIVGLGGASIALAPLLPYRSGVSGLAWSPDGTRFAFVASNADGVGDIYTVGVDGTGLRRLTHLIGAVGTLSWR